MRTLESEVGAGEARLVRSMDNDAQVSEVGRVAFFGGEEEVDIAGERFCQH